MKLLKSMFARKSSTPGSDMTPGRAQTMPAPDQPLFVVGDIHGRIDLLENILEQIDAAIGEFKLSEPKLIFVGDAIDRGPDSAAVLARLQELTREFPQNVIVLLGNHEQMLLDFLGAPAARQARWFRNGGVETCLSYGLTKPLEQDMQAEADGLADQLRDALGQDVLNWLRARPITMRSGNVVIAHAGLDPGRPPDDQNDRIMIWGHPEFMSRGRSDGIWVAHGHVVVDEAVCQDSRISVDTGAWHTEKLTAAMILPSGHVEFFSTRST